MKRLMLAILSSALLCGMCSCLNDDAQSKGESERSQMSDEGDGTSHGHVGHTGEHDKSLDQEALVGGEATRKRLSDMSPEEAEQEIRILVKKIDMNTDGLLSKGELMQWLKKTEEKATRSEVHNGFVAEDIDQNGFVTFEEFLTKVGLTSEDEPQGDTQELERKRFSLADLNKDGQLNEEEFSAFVNPSRHDHMIEHLILEQLRMHDKDNDGYINLSEFMRIYSPEHGPEQELPAWVESEKQEFTTVLDVDGDMKLDVDEMKKWLSANDDEFFSEEAEHLMSSADQNEDDLLSLEEVLEELDIFMDSPITDYGHLKHEEL